MGILNKTVRRERKYVGIATRSEALNSFLAAVLEEWGHEVVSAPHATAILLAEADCVAGKGWSETLYLGDGREANEETLVYPLSLERLWRILESRFFKPTRSHIRIDLDREIKLKVRDRPVDATLVSLSDLGCRVSLAFELVKDEEPLLQLRLQNRTMLLQGKVFYSIMKNNHSTDSQVGIRFQRVNAENSRLIRDFITSEYLLRARKKLPGWVFNESLPYLDLSPGVLGALRNAQ